MPTPTTPEKLPFEWDACLDVLHSRMDGDHKALFSYFQEFRELAKDAQHNHEAIREVVMNFLSLASTHFMFEERMMASSTLLWEEVKAHMDDHLKVQATFLALIGPLMQNSVDWETYTQTFLDVFVSHLTIYDKPLATHLLLHPDRGHTHSC